MRALLAGAEAAGGSRGARVGCAGGVVLGAKGFCFEAVDFLDQDSEYGRDDDGTPQDDLLAAGPALESKVVRGGCLCQMPVVALKAVRSGTWCRCRSVIAEWHGFVDSMSSPLLS